MVKTIMKRISPELEKSIKQVQREYSKAVGKKISFVKASKLYSSTPTRLLICNKKRNKKMEVIDLLGKF